MSGAQIVVIEDDDSIRLGLEDTLRSKGYRVAAAATGAKGLTLVRSLGPDLVILDIMLPDTDGFAVCRKLKSSREFSELPVIMLSARGAELDRVRGLEIGADDYVTKPFSLMELLARVAVVLRRGPHRPRSPETLQFGDVHIDFRHQRATRGGAPVELSTRAFAILRVFARHPGEVVTRETLLAEAWGYDKSLNTRTVDNHLVKLRKALEAEPDEPRHLLTVHGAGYKLVGAL